MLVNEEQQEGPFDIVDYMYGCFYNDFQESSKRAG